MKIDGNNPTDGKRSLIAVLTSDMASVYQRISGRVALIQATLLESLFLAIKIMENKWPKAIAIGQDAQPFLCGGREASSEDMVV